MRTISLIIALTLSPVATVATPLLVLGGEHNEFSRVVVYLNQLDDFDIEKHPEGISIVINGHNDGFITENLFKRLNRNRIASVKSSLDTLELKLSCNCEFSYFSEDLLLIIDIFNAEKRQVDLPESKNRDQGDGYNSLPDSPLPSPRGNSLLPIIHYAKFDFTASSHDYLWSRVFNHATVSPSEKNDNEDNSNGQSLVVKTALSDPTETDMGGQRKKYTQLPNISITGGSSAAIYSSTGEQEKTCPKQKSVNIVSWSNGGSIVEEISTLRRLAVNSTGGLNQKSIENSIRQLLANGFAQEAKKLSIGISNSSERKIYSFLSDLFISEDIVSPPTDWKWKNCKSFAHLWYMISGKATRLQSSESISLALRQYSSLDKHIRKILFSRISSQAWASVDQSVLSQISHIQIRPWIQSTASDKTHNEKSLDYSTIAFQAKTYISKVLAIYRETSKVSSSDIEKVRYYVYLLDKESNSLEHGMGNVILGIYDENYGLVEEKLKLLFRQNHSLALDFFDSILKSAVSNRDDYDFLLFVTSLSNIILKNANAKRLGQIEDRAARLGFILSQNESLSADVDGLASEAPINGSQENRKIDRGEIKPSIGSQDDENSSSERRSKYLKMVENSMKLKNNIRLTLSDRN